MSSYPLPKDLSRSAIFQRNFDRRGSSITENSVIVHPNQSYSAAESHLGDLSNNMIVGGGSTIHFQNSNLKTPFQKQTSQDFRRDTQSSTKQH